MRPRPIALWTTGTLIFLSMVFLRWFAADQLMYGPQDADVFEARPYGVAIDRETAPFFLMWTRSDGQAFFSIAGDLNGDEQAAGLGNLSYRMSRIGMSVMARALTLGNEDWLAYTLPVVSLLCYGALVVLSVRLFDRLGPRALLLPLTPAAVIGTIYDSAEALGTVLLVASLTATTLLASSAFGLLLGVSRPSYGIGLPASRHGLLPAALALGAGGALQLLVVYGFDIPFSGGAGNLALPFVGLSQEWSAMGSIGRLVAVVVLSTALALAALGFSRNYLTWFRATAFITAAFSLCIGASVYQETFSPFRATAPALVLIILAPIFRTSRTAGGTA